MGLKMNSSGPFAKRRGNPCQRLRAFRSAGGMKGVGIGLGDWFGTITGCPEFAAWLKVQQIVRDSERRRDRWMVRRGHHYSTSTSTPPTHLAITLYMNAPMTPKMKPMTA